METVQSIFAERRTYSDVAIAHAHSFAQLILPLRGSLSIETSQHDLELDDSHLFFLLPDCQHTFLAKENNEFLVLDIPTFLLPKDMNLGQGSLNAALDERWQAIRFLLLSEVDRGLSHQQALTELFRYAFSLLHSETLPRSLQYLKQSYARSLDLNQLAKLEGYNPTYYCEWFKKLTGTTPKAYIQSLRLQKAKELLTYTDLSILQIAQQVGYEQHSSLTRLFQQQEKVTPQAYRQQSRNLDKK